MMRSSMQQATLKIRFWGVRGSRPVPGPETVVYGGNTACVEVQAGENTIILDAGTGICDLGKQLMNAPFAAHLLITHTHWDHIQGFPFFSPAFLGQNSLWLYGEGKSDLSFADQLRNLMQTPHFPVQLDQMAAKIRFREVRAGESFTLAPGVTVRTASNNHPNGALSYRIDYAGRSCCYVTDTEHRQEVDADLAALCRHADLVIYDAAYTEDEYYGRNGLPSRVGWGHSTWQEGVKLVLAAQAKRLVLFHHEPDRTDSALAQLEHEAQAVYPNCLTAREKMVIEL